MPRAILFDLDGTLVQTRESSWRLFSKTNEAFGLGIATQEDYFRLLENNLFSSLRQLAGNDERYRRASAHFLDLLKREYDPPFVPGMVDVIKSLAGLCSLTVVSSNATQTIRRILTNAGLKHCFSHVFGGDVEPDKRACVRRFLADASYSINRQCVPAYVESHRPENPTESQVVLVTDTVGDVRHAIECGIRVVGVAWGMHSEEQLLQAGAEFVAIWPQEIVAHLFPDGVAAPPCGIEPAAVGVQQSGFESFHRDCGCTGDGKSCQCSGRDDHAGGPPSGSRHDCNCSAQDNLLVQASRLRRLRSRAATGTLSARLTRSGQSQTVNRPVLARVDDQLISCLARIRGVPTQAG